MGKKDSGRREFFRKLAGKYTDADAADTLVADNATDPLFRKYARKTIGQRQYAPPTPPPATDSPAADEQPKDADTGTAQARVGTVTSGIAAYTGTWGQAEAMHLLRRTGYGLKKARVDAVAGMTMSAAVDAITDLAAAPMTLPSATPLNNYHNATFSDSGGIAAGADWTLSNLPYTTASSSNDADTDGARRGSLMAWSWGRVLSNDDTIREKMTHFWYHFIPVGIYDVEAANGANSTLVTHYYVKLLRENALGNFKTLMQAIAKHPAMLLYLGGQSSTASQPNENFGRELMELFTMGKTPTQNYTEPDVQAAAKCLSGWRVTSFKTAFAPVPPATTIAAQPYPVAYNNSYHNQSATKVFSANFGSTSIANNNTGAEFDSFFNMLFGQQAGTISRYICRRLYRFFVYYDIDANVEANVIVPLAAALVAANWDMLTVVRTLLKSEHFYHAVNRGVMIKSPFDLVAGTARTLNINATATGITLTQQYNLWTYFHNWAKNNMEQSWLDVPNVSGWKAYYQTPAYYQNWINSNTIQQRSKFLTAMVNGTTQQTVLLKLDPIAWVQQFPAATVADPVLLLDAVIPYLLPVDLDAAYKDQLRTQTLQNNLASQVGVNNPWTTAWNAYVSNQNATNTNTVVTRLKNMFNSLLQLAEAQLM